MASCLPSGDNVADGRHDVRVGGAATDVAAHPLADLGVGQRDLGGCHVGGGVTGPAGLRLGEHTNGGADLARRAVPHWNPSRSTKAIWRGWSEPGEPSPSIVITSSPSCMTASVRQALIRRPLTITVHAPH